MARAAIFFGLIIDQRASFERGGPNAVMRVQPLGAVFHIKAKHTFKAGNSRIFSAQKLTLDQNSAHGFSCNSRNTQTLIPCTYDLSVCTATQRLGLNGVQGFAVLNAECLLARVPSSKRMYP